jgi:hypothetical protein
MNERISLFDLATLPFELYLYKNHALLTVQKTKKQPNVQTPLFGKKDGPSPMNSVSFS